MKVKVREVHSVFAWTWHIPKESQDAHAETIDDNDGDDVCGICRASYNATCPGCKFPGDGCPLVVGECNHNFHVHCIYRWLDTATSRGLCPMCRQTFQLKKGLAINDSQISKFQELRNKQWQTRQQEFGDQQDPETNPLEDQDDPMMDQGLIVR